MKGGGDDRLYKRYLLGVLLVILAFSIVDRLALGLIAQSLKTDLHVTDTQLGFLTGIAFALFYSILGVPIARWADRGNRVAILTISMALWTVAVVACGFARTFSQLLLARVGAAVGEAGCMPTANSLIADYFPRAERPRALAVCMLGSPLSALVGFFLAGWLNQYYGWRTTLIALGLPGLALAALAASTLREPRRAAKDAGRAHDREKPSTTSPGILSVCRALWVRRAFRHVLVSFSVASFFGVGIVQWQPAFFIRSHGLTTGELGTWLSLIFGLGGAVGTYWGGALASRLAAGNERLQLNAMAVVYCLFAVVSVFIYLASYRSVALGLTALTAVGGAMTGAPLFATIQTLVPPDMRATAIAFVYLFANLIGGGLGPLAVGALSDELRPWLGEESLRYTLAALCPGYLWAGWHLWIAGRTVTEDIEAVYA